MWISSRTVLTPHMSACSINFGAGVELGNVIESRRGK